MNMEPSILLVEDDDNDVFFMRRAFQQASLLNRLMVVRNGRAAIQYVSGEGMYSDRIRFPEVSLMLLDLSMPILTGWDVLAWLQRSTPKRDVAVVVVTSSPNPTDVHRAIALGAVDYVVKPGNSTLLVSILREKTAHWLSLGLARNLPRSGGMSDAPEYPRAGCRAA
jgi:CheY-like chemotaxis protein